MERNSGRVRPRYFRASGQMDARNADSMEAGDFLSEPSGVEAIPAEPADIQVTLLSHFRSLLGSRDPRFTVQMIPRPLVGTSSKPSDTSTSKEQGASRDPDETFLDVSLADSGTPAWDDKTICMGRNLEDRDHAINFPTFGWPRSEHLCGA